MASVVHDREQLSTRIRDADTSLIKMTLFKDRLVDERNKIDESLSNSLLSNEDFQRQIDSAERAIQNTIEECEEKEERAKISADTTKKMFEKKISLLEEKLLLTEQTSEEETEQLVILREEQRITKISLHDKERESLELSEKVDESSLALSALEATYARSARLAESLRGDLSETSST